MSSRQLCRRLMRYIAPNWEVLAFALAGMIVMAATVPMLAALLRPLLDEAITGKNRELMQLVLMGIIALFAVRGAAGHISTYAINWLGSKLTADLRVDMFEKLLSLPGRYYASHSAGSLISRITSDSDQVARTFIAVATILVKDTFTIIGLLGWAFYLDWQLSLLALSMTCLILLIVRLIAVKLQRMESDVGQSVDGITSVVQESIENYAAVKLYGGQQYESRRVREQTAGMHRFIMKRTAVAALGIPVIQMATAAALAATIYFAVQQSFVDEITAGGFASLIAALAMLVVPVKRIAGIKATLQPGLIAGDSIFSLLDEPPEPETGTVAIERTRGELRFEQVSFCPAVGDGFEAGPESGFEACSVLRDINLMVHPGEMVALVSFQTSSAAALANLVPLFFRPVSGRILLDGRDLQSISLASLRANIALISADAELFNDTIAANIAYGDMSCATEARIMSAAYAARVSEFVRELPEGLQTPVGTQGLKLSAGQRFRIAIARALLKNSPVLIVNEISKALDAETTHHMDALEAVTRGRTTLVITHRLATLSKTDRVVLLHKGSITAIGSHSELLAKHGTYARLARTFI
ncbi:ABC transporter transmembrane domain-containing protein [Nitrosovibrio tenuis]|uniref:ATP-binding cassette, subfamily B, MsbA n=1 Tax=Nitrosovibrio tenuis TaxID=1233 RepID=A0A1H7GVY8_9PROT|nr:ABC transporter transmembrane domain-containing protein [Nitrosovibrio tenuis]SEK40045.1 ATP-binding cassette, subfamily B, MsbA [Nitrosovibrio tenuis]